MTKKLSYAAILALLAMSSCTNDDVLNSSKSEYVNSVRVTVEDFISESPATRTAYTVDNTGFHFQWADGDALGIYPVGGDQVKFPISSGDGSASAAFDGGAWKLRSEYQYAAYYPFSANNYTTSERALPVSYTGQTQNGNGTTAHLGAYDYLACAATAPDGNGGVDLTMKHLGAFLRLQLTMPKADTYSSVVLESDGTKFVTAGTFDLTATTPAITSTATSATYTINLTNVATTEKNQMITVYAMVAPANLSNSNIKVTVHGTGQTTYVQTVAGKNFAARSAYNIPVGNFPNGTNVIGENVSWEDYDPYIGHEYVDLGLPNGLKWATMNLGATTPEDFGNYYAWGEVIGYSKDENHLFNWENYKWCNGSSTSLTKYCVLSSFGTIDNKTELDPEDDAAIVNWGGSWRMPTQEEFKELLRNCTCTWATKNGVEGISVASQVTGSSIFLPAVRYRRDNIYNGDGRFFEGCYWCSSIRTDDYNCCAEDFYIFYDKTNPSRIERHYGSIERYLGIPIRAVCP